MAAMACGVPSLSTRSTRGGDGVMLGAERVHTPSVLRVASLGDARLLQRPRGARQLRGLVPAALRRLLRVHVRATGSS